MPYRAIPLVNGEIYHIFNRGVAKQVIFGDIKNQNRLKETLYYYQFKGPKPSFSQTKRFNNLTWAENPKIVEIICYCLMQNHFHLIVRQLEEGGISEFIRKASDSYTKYFNTKYKRVGPLLQGQFKAVRVETNEQLIHLSRYIHLNPSTSFLVEDLNNHQFSSYHDYIGTRSDKLVCKDPVLEMFKSPAEYQKFVLDQKDYYQTLKLIEHQLLEDL